MKEKKFVRLSFFKTSETTAPEKIHFQLVHLQKRQRLLHAQYASPGAYWRGLERTKR